MSDRPDVDFFANEAAWPFTLHMRELAKCEAFLAGHGEQRVLKIFGPSGSGKSFLIRELMGRLSNGDDKGVGLYLDFPAGEIEAAELLGHADALLSGHRASSRDHPSFVGKKVTKAWLAARRDGPSRGASYGYGAGRELTGQIPIAGPFVKAVLPTSVPARPQRDADVTLLRFLLRRSRSHSVLLVLDNVQFIPYAIRELIQREIAESGHRLRLVLIERVYDQPRIVLLAALRTFVAGTA